MAAVIRTSVLALLIGGAVALALWRLGSDRQQQRLMRELEALNGQLEARNQMLDRLNRSRRIAHVRILDQEMHDTGGIAQTNVLFLELDDDGAELARQTFTLPGEVLYIDAWTVKFDRDTVAEGHPLYGRTLILLRRIFSDQLAPRDGYAIDTPGAVPPGYAVSDAGRFQQQIWAHFWEIATDAELAKSMRVRVAQGEAVYKPVRAGQTYELIVDAAAGMSLAPLAPEPELAQGE